MLKLISFLLIVVTFALSASGGSAVAKKNTVFLRDAEIEGTIRAYATPLFRAAGLAPNAIEIYIVKDKSLNAFVAGGQKLFINSGLLTRSTDAGQVIGVIAHETGHISGGHLARTHDAMRNSTAQMIMAYVLGGAAAIGGRPDVGQAILLGGQQLGMNSFLKYSRTQEGAADQAAMTLLDATGQSARGLLGFMETLSDQELLSAQRQDPYLRTHPMARDRISSLQAHIQRSPNTDKPVSAAFQRSHSRMRAKLFSFIDPPTVTLRRYRETDTSVEARLARAVAYYRRSDIDQAVVLIDGLIAEQPDDPYFHELKGQMLFENGRSAGALRSYQRAVDLAPRAALIRADLAKVQLESQDPAMLDPAIKNLRATLQFERRNPFVWHQLAIGYGRKGEMGMSGLAMAEEAMLRGRREDALYHAGKAEKLLPEGSSGWMHARDIMHIAKPSPGAGRR